LNPRRKRNYQTHTSSCGVLKRCWIKKLVYLEEYNDINQAIAREKQFKNWHRDWRLNLIKKVNPELKDMSVFD